MKLLFSGVATVILTRSATPVEMLDTTNAINAAACACQQVFFTRYHGLIADDFLEQAQLRTAKSLATLRRGADRTMILDQQPVVPLFFDACHISFRGAQLGQLRQFLGDAAQSMAGLDVVLAHLALALRDQSIESFFAKQLFDRCYQLHRQVGMRIGETRMT